MGATHTGAGGGNSRASGRCRSDDFPLGAPCPSYSDHRARWCLLAVAAVATLLSPALAVPASAHGSVANPVSRNYGCWQRWGGDFQNPRMATEDPMCWQAWQTDTNAMWNWNGLFREGVAGNHQAAIPNGQLCSGGRTENGRYRAMDAVGAWRTTSVANNFRLKFYDQASHGADYIRVYATRQGYDALTTPLAWSHLELVGQIGNTPASQWQREAGGVSVEVPVNAPNRTGRHVIFTIWQASHSDQSYYICSDVQFGGGLHAADAPPAAEQSAADHLADPHSPADDPADHRPDHDRSAGGGGVLGDVPDHQHLVRRLPGRGAGDGGQRAHPRLAGELDVRQRPTGQPGLERHGQFQRLHGDRHQRQLQRQPRRRSQHHLRAPGLERQHQQHADADLHGDRLTPVGAAPSPSARPRPAGRRRPAC